MNTRFLVFYTIALVGVLTFSYFQQLNNPAVPNGEPLNATAANQNEEQGGEEADPAVQQDTASTNEGSSGLDSNPDSAEQTAEGAGGPDSEVVAKTPPSQLYTIGSIDPASRHRFLVTVDSAGGAIRRVELNYRDKKTRHRYRDLEFLGGYLGELDCVDSDEGCRIRVVGHGTPAFTAGMEPNDVIKSIDGEPVLTAEDLQNMLLETKPKQTVEIVFVRNESDVSCQVVLTDKPIELMRPQPDILDKGWSALPSFRTTLREYNPQKAVWPELDLAIRDGVWKLASQSDDQISLEFVIAADSVKGNKELESSGLAGPFVITKTYTVPSIAGEDTSSFNRDFHIDFDFSIRNESSKQQKICYQLDGPLGTPSETWWYQNKIHGETWAFFKSAGARDIVGSTGQSEFTFFGCPAIVANLRKTAPAFFWVLAPPAGDPAAQQVNFLSVDAQYFNVSLLPKSEQQPFTAYSVVADTTDLGGKPYPKDLKEQKLVDVTFRMFKDIELAPQQSYQQSFEIFCGPKHGDLLELYALDSVRTFGWFSIFSKFLCRLLGIFHWATFGLGYGIPIILLTMVVRSLMIPISRKAALNAQMMQYLAPQIKELTEKYGDDMEKKGQAQQALFAKYNYNPLSGCVMMVFQIPIFIGLYRGLSVDIALRDQPLFPGLNWATNLSAPDQFWYWKDALPISFLTDETGWLGPYLNLLPIITCLLFVVQQQLFTPPATDEQQEMMQKVMKYAMIFMGLLFFKVPAGLCLYFITSSLWGIVERKMLPRPELDTSKLDGIDGGKSKDSGSDKKKQKKLEQKEKRRVEELDEKKRRDKERKRKLKKRDSQ